ncbi:b(0,+)-type amino acid transporter 1 [Nematostella vectensis]|uniref:b(0,+)-type amino acid transporter 1 n=1 Tax=Nematostella vectensis TaxID=45351 RepID=UPI002077717B|nr:b(0,+)-type amino acid transporter 1 [Nematostella vectensis]
MSRRAHKCNADSVKSEEETEDMTLLRSKVDPKAQGSITLLQGVAIIIGIMIGSGIFVSPKFVLENTGSVGMMVVAWALCGLVATLGSLCYCELGTLIQKSGGELVYFREAFGSLPAFLVSWTIILVLKPSSIAIISMAFASYAYLPFITPGTPEPTTTIKLIAAGCIILLTIVNCVSTQFAAKSQVVFMVMKLTAIAVVVLLGAYHAFSGHTNNFQDLFKGTSTNLGKLAHAFYSGLWAFDGWNQLNYCTGELKNPHVNLPRAALIALPLVTICYILINMAYLCILSPAEIISSEAVAVTFADKVNHPIIMALIPILVSCSCFGAANSSIFTNAKVVCAAVKQGHMPLFLGAVNKRLQMPIYAVASPSFIGLLLLIPSNLGSLISCFSFVAWGLYGGAFLSLLVFRWKFPTQRQPYRVWTVVPVFMLLISIYLIISPFASKPKESAFALGYIFTGVPFYFVFASKK